MHQAIDPPEQPLPPTVLGLAGEWTRYASGESESGCTDAFISVRAEVSVNAYRYEGTERGGPYWIVTLWRKTAARGDMALATGSSSTLEDAEELVRFRLDQAAEIAQLLRTARAA